ncbi:MlaD family protein [Nocardia sp. CA2R105]|uniref:MlaD family protein n=1 Tax=Nocardia coffeae TaxID=2873381 RepID=UPI001CA7A4A5|nr:MlaD family protein [Nocardia coffeae]MBY8863417.1 MlaD family protein [Nocardia coffeae]
MPGTTGDCGRSLRTGAAAITIVALVVVGWTAFDHLRGDHRLHVSLQTELIGDGIDTGSHVQLRGVDVGQVDRIEPLGGDRQRITLSLNRSELHGLDDSLGIEYAPANTFGISVVELRYGPGGAPLSDNATIDLTGRQSGRVDDATMGSLIRSLTQTATQVLTPQFADVLRQAAIDLRAFTPLLQTIVVTAQSIADTQRYASSYLIQQYSSTLDGAAPMIDGTIKLLDHINNIEVLRNDKPLFDAGVAMIVDKLWPALGQLGVSMHRNLGDYTTMLTPLLSTIASTVPTPQRSSAELTQLLDRLNRDFAETPAGPTLNLRLTLHDVPAVAIPLLGPAPVQTGSR